MKKVTRWPSAVLALLLLAAASPSWATEILARVTAGPAFVTGEVGDRLVGTGVDIGAGVYAGLDEKLFLGGSGHYVFYGGQSVTTGFVKEKKTKGGDGFTVEAGVLYYILKEEGKRLRIYVGAHLGLGRLSWEYSEEVESVTGQDADSMDLFSFAPEAGVELALGTSAGVFATGRYMLASYGDPTSDGFPLGMGGGDVFTLQAGIGLSF